MENVITQNVIETSETNSENNSQWIIKDKTELLQQTNFGVLLAFFDRRGKARSGALCDNDVENKIVTVVTEYGWEFKVPYSEVIWVKNGTRWPRGVYNLLKGKN